MSHTARCADSASTRCKCECDGSLHGVSPGPIYRTLYDAYARDTAPDHAVLRAVDETAVEVLTELMRRAPDDLEQVRGIVEEALTGQAWLLLWDGGKPSKKLNRRHWLCAILADLADAVDELIDFPGMISDAGYKTATAKGWGPLRSRAAARIIEAVFKVTFTSALEPIATLPLKIRLVALMFCPGLAKHSELEQGFAHDLRDALGDA
ncbi:hypothetical protein GCM10009745_70770 [Kribbella yunnanensis]|uniref:Uncharacterized protein n=1 Tax=Kribbella yunnanensis TaxID=190194 RepID=A0ABN2IV33_9ACTN